MKKKTNSSHYSTISIVLLGAIVFFISLLLLPKTPSVDQGAVTVKIATQKINEGRQLGNQELIMEGVGMLKTVLEKDTNNIDAIWQLGQLSMESSQYVKAIERFEKFVRLTEADDKASGLLLLADAYFLSGRQKDAINCLVEARKLTKDTKLLTEIDDRLNIINKI